MAIKIWKKNAHEVKLKYLSEYVCKQLKYHQQWVRVTTDISWETILNIFKCSFSIASSTKILTLANSTYFWEPEYYFFCCANPLSGKTALNGMDINALVQQNISGRYLWIFSSFCMKNFMIERLHLWLTFKPCCFTYNVTMVSLNIEIKWKLLFFFNNQSNFLFNVIPRKASTWKTITDTNSSLNFCLIFIFRWIFYKADMSL